WTTVQTSSCGEKLTWDMTRWPFEGVVKSPQFPKAVDPHSSCTWELNSTLGEEFSTMFHYQASFDYFDVPSSTEDCHDDFLKFTALDSTRSDDSRMYCNKHTPGVGNQLSILYRTPHVTLRTSSLAGGGFSMNFRLSCDKILEDREVLSTFFKPTSFPYNCTYRMEKSENTLIVIKFEYISENLRCIGAALERLTINNKPVLCDDRSQQPAIEFEDDVSISYQTLGMNESNYSLIVKRIEIPTCFHRKFVTTRHRAIDQEEKVDTNACLFQLSGDDIISLKFSYFWPDSPKPQKNTTYPVLVREHFRPCDPVPIQTSLFTSSLNLAHSKNSSILAHVS
ncbi:hypothetical protein PMAYCL1PPCAC_28341, partial [Pristionchus mayeri]